MAEDKHPISIDPREVLTYLNEEGIHHITGERLAEFIKDLKLIMKQDLKQNKSRKLEPKSAIDKIASRFQRLHKTHTVCSLSKCKSIEDSTCQKFGTYLKLKGDQTQRALRDIITYSADSKSLLRKSKQTELKTDAPTANNNVQGAAESLIPSEKKSAKLKSSPRSSTQTIDSNQSLKQKALRRSDPVTLFHSYNSMWQKKKLPGENNWNEVRQAVKRKFSR